MTIKAFTVIRMNYSEYDGGIIADGVEIELDERITNIKECPDDR